MTKTIADAIVAHCLKGLPDEACGLFGGDVSNAIVRDLYLSENMAHSALIYTVDPKVHLRADRDAEGKGGGILGVFHSHTHTEAYPSPTDVAQAPDPSWHYVIVSLRGDVASIRSFTIIGGVVSEEAIEIL
jgi:proteasome lid subunit RPN8/RPN11